MKVIIVSSSDIQGGAARATFRLHKALLSEGVNSQMIVQSKLSDDFSVLPPPTRLKKLVGNIRPILDSIPVRRYKKRSKTLFSPSWLPLSGIVDQINSLEPDVVHLHWIAGGMLRIEELNKIKAPIVWSLHDMWPFTGGCHYDEGCFAYTTQCSQCPVLGSKSYRDLSHKLWFRKKASFGRLRKLTIVGVSEWLAYCAASSSLLKDYPVVKLPNPIDTLVFSPFERVESRKLLNLPVDRKLILFGAIGATSDPRKGYKELVQALEHLPSEYELVVFGSSRPKVPQRFKQKAHYLGHLHDDVSLRVLYSAADVMVVPSLQEAFGQTASESMACGTPVVAFGTTGLLDIVDHRLNGYLAQPYDTQDLANGIDWVIQHKAPEQLSLAAREKVLREFDSKVVAAKYIALYEQMLQQSCTK
ncbi:TPA: glycosyltransferase family 4 protein [Vibrio cholerae]|uniref:glycosyltransferase family 4 protein n=1 Tax=Vibrio cholerae TaxID=666 RepID=UPI002067DA80|nr:putative glycosyltransferase [Vibrio cholerae]GHZ48431.1 glycosyl transferase [Vibrio cholerae]